MKRREWTVIAILVAAILALAFVASRSTSSAAVPSPAPSSTTSPTAKAKVETKVELIPALRGGSIYHPAIVRCDVKRFTEDTAAHVALVDFDHGLALYKCTRGW